MAYLSIGQEAFIEPQDWAQWSGMVNFRPGVGEIVNLNPPLFSWLQKDEDPNSIRDKHQRIFRFQAAYDSAFTIIAVDVVTESNCYNFLAPFTENQVWWRVGYIIPAHSPNIDHWSAVRTFTIANDAVEWDRSMLADESYLASKAHPRILFNSGNLTAFSTHTKLTTEWPSIKAKADAAIISTWWANKTVAYTSGHGRLLDLQAVAFVWQMTKEDKYLNTVEVGRAQELLVLLAQEYINNGAAWVDSSNQWGGIERIGQIYDWLYEVMTPEQRVSVATNIGLHCKFSLNVFTFRGALVAGSFPLDPTKDSYLTGWYPESNRKDGLGSAYNYFSSHMDSNLGRSFTGALGAYSENEDARKLFDLSLNLILGKPQYAGTEEGVDTAVMYGVNGTAKLLWKYSMLHLTFPEAHLNRHPHLAEVSDWWSRMRPVGCEAEIDCWSDGYPGMGACFPSWSRYLAWFTGDGAALKQYNIEHARVPLTLPDVDLVNTGTPPNSYTYTIFACSYYADAAHDQDAGYLPFPTEVDRQPASKAFPGWAFASSGPTTDISSFNNGLGFVFCCRPSALGGKNHDHPMDLSFELKAYGHNITENTCPNWEYGKKPEGHNTLMVNGIGPRNGYGLQRTAIPGRIFAFKTTDDYTYCAGEGMNLYPPATIAILNKVNRHLLMVRNKFFVVFDDMEAKQPATFSWLYHVLENTPGNDVVSDLDPNKPGTFKYRKTKTPANLDHDYVYEGEPVSVYVSHIASRNQLNFLDLSGAERMKNPITGVTLTLTPYQPDIRTHVLWTSNNTPLSSFQFMTVVYPVSPDDTANELIPIIEKIDDFTVRVTSPDNTVDIVSFDPNYVDDEVVSGVVIIVTTDVEIPENSPPVNIVVPSIILPTGATIPQEGHLLTSSNGTWGGYPLPGSAEYPYGYRWLRYSPPSFSTGVSISTSQSYLMVAADIGCRIRFEVTAENSSAIHPNGVIALSPFTDIIVAAPLLFAPSCTYPPEIAGRPQEGYTLAGSLGTWEANPNPEYDYQWFRYDTQGSSPETIEGATFLTYLLTVNDVGHLLNFVVRAVNSEGFTTATSDFTGVITAASEPPSTGGTRTQWDKGKGYGRRIILTY